MNDFLLLWLLSAGVVIMVMLCVALAARALGRVSVVDVAWGLGFVAIAVACAVAAADWRGWLLAALTGIWGMRLASHIGIRGKGHGEDPRYQKLLADGGGILRKVLVPQGLAMWFVSLPLVVSAVAGDSWTPVIWVGLAFWCAGMAFEVIGDAQLASYKRDPDRGPVMDRGLWAWTRHPNYFGDAVIWWGLWLIAASAWPGVLTVLSPLAMTLFLRNVTGAKLLERTMMKRPGYPEYAARVPMFFPRPPRTSA